MAIPCLPKVAGSRGWWGGGGGGGGGDLVAIMPLYVCPEAKEMFVFFASSE